MPSVGIDLGTTHCRVAVWTDGGQVETFANEHGHRMTPSCVSFSRSQRLLGKAAKRQMAVNPTNTIFNAQRLIGRQFSDPQVQEDAKHWPFKVVQMEGDRPYLEVQFRGEARSFAPEEVAAMMLLEMKQVAEAQLGTRIDSAVVSVPAHYNYVQRMATMDAGSIAGIRIKRLINDTSAAAIARWVEGKDEYPEESHVLVFDLGGGTLSVSLMALEDEVLEVRATSGNVHLGGEDFDSRIVHHFVQEFKRKNHGMDLRDDPCALRRLRTACERAKRTLSDHSVATIEIDALYQGVDFYTSLTRARFESLCHDLFLACLPPVRGVLRDSKIDARQVGKVVLVGGSTRMPKVHHLLKELFHGLKLTTMVHPDEAVAHGAAVQAAILDGRTDERFDDMILLDVTPHTLGIESIEGVFVPIIPRHTTIPTGKDHVVSVPDSAIRVYEGERYMSFDNQFLGQVEIPDAHDQLELVGVSFSMDAHGILDVGARPRGDGPTERIRVTADRCRLSQDDITRMATEAATWRVEEEAHPRANLRRNLEARNAFERELCSLRRDFRHGAWSSLAAADRWKTKEVILNTLDRAQTWLDTAQELHEPAIYRSRMDLIHQMLPPSSVCQVAEDID